MQQIVEREIEECRQRFGVEKALNLYLSNFHSNLPTDNPEDRSYLRNVVAFLGVLDKTRLEYDAEDSREGSELWKRQTFREFFKTIDNVLDELKIPISDIIRLQALVSRLAVDSGGIPAITKLNELILPAYVRLRGMGYNRYPDLVR